MECWEKGILMDDVLYLLEAVISQKVSFFLWQFWFNVLVLFVIKKNIVQYKISFPVILLLSNFFYLM